jgi:hypothetical protein
LPVVDPPELRYADRPGVEVAIDIRAAPEVVWRLASDIGLPARFSTEFRGAEWLDGVAGPGLGAQFVGHNHHPAIGAWETTATVVEFEPGRVFAWVIGDPATPSATWRFRLQPTAAGTRLSQEMTMGPARSGINLAIDAMPGKESKILHRRLAEHRANMEANLLGIKNAAEG